MSPAPSVLPGQAFQQINLRSKLAFYWRGSDMSLESLSTHSGTFSRTSAGGMVAGQGYVRSSDRVRLIGPASDGEERWEFVATEGGSTRDAIALLLEGQRKNSLTRSENFGHADWTSSTGITVTSTGTGRGPDFETDSGDDVADGSTAESASVNQSVTVADDSNDRCGSLFIKRSTSAPNCALEINYTGSTVGGSDATYRLWVTPGDGSSTTSIAGSSTVVTNHSVDEFSTNWWRVWIAGANTSTGHTSLEYRFYPATSTSLGSFAVGSTGAQTIYGAQLEGV